MDAVCFAVSFFIITFAINKGNGYDLELIFNKSTQIP